MNRLYTLGAAASIEAVESKQSSHSRFLTQVDVHCGKRMVGEEEVDGAEAWSLPRPEEIIHLENQVGSIHKVPNHYLTLIRIPVR